MGGSLRSWPPRVPRETRTQHRPASRQVNGHGRVSGTHRLWALRRPGRRYRVAAGEPAELERLESQRRLVLTLAGARRSRRRCELLADAVQHPGSVPTAPAAPCDAAWTSELPLVPLPGDRRSNEPVSCRWTLRAPRPAGRGHRSARRCVRRWFRSHGWRLGASGPVRRWIVSTGRVRTTAPRSRLAVVPWVSAGVVGGLVNVNPRRSRYAPC